MTVGAAARIGSTGRELRDAADAAAGRGRDRFESALDYELFRVADLGVSIGELLAATLALLAAWLASKLMQRALARYGETHAHVNAASLYLLARVLHYLILVAGVLVALDLAGVPIGKFTVFAGALGVGLGFGLQAIFSNFISGLILLFDRSLKVGDFVELESGVHGEVRDIKIRATTIVTNDNIDILVPNAEFVTGRVVNWTHREVSRRMRVKFGVAYGTDKELVKKAALEAAAEVPFTLALDGPRRPQVWLVEFGDSALNFELVVWLNAEATKRPSAVNAAYLWALDNALCRYGIEIPYPQQDLHIRSLFGLQGEAALAALRGERIDAPAAPPVPHVGVATTSTSLAHHERAQLSSNDAQRDVQERIDVAPDLPTPNQDSGAR
ncbi:MAG: Potassium efflux system KefA protein / Small-conductance mechanosensitive channel [uncultured Lysobacter sp.]|uniref:Potassium efflux system KefA protein / Small-conductance mechanosensitive channel n=1 Tax=uncultured Lysobacter sp. TaxID=271060 RepID=A0A6J4KPV2_9GAMM|nr:MAG: Potassium efflux system KefA protein / Small-conductance mechanosensitive channel [uncultured Lysobacter sp.]